MRASLQRCHTEMRGAQRLQPLHENSWGWFWEGHDFSRAVRPLETNRALAPGVRFPQPKEFFSGLLRTTTTQAPLRSRRKLVVTLRFGDSILADLVQQRLIADLQNHRGLLAVPVGLFQGVGNGLALRLRLWRRAPAISILRNPVALGRSLLPAVAVVPGLEFSHARFSSPRIKIALQEIIQLAQIARPGVILAGLQQRR